MSTLQFDGVQFLSMEDLKLTRNRDKDLIERATLVVEEYISKQRLIIYGGTAIDFALRTRGKNIYNDVTLKYADYDFFSSNVTLDSFELATALKTTMATDDINIINAVHMRTLKVSIEGHFIADITYCPQTVIDRIPTIEYTTIAGNTVVVVAPHFQAIDMHSALSQPYDNPPMEVYNQRIAKDIGRFNMLYDEFFPELRDVDRLSTNGQSPIIYSEQKIEIPSDALDGAMVVGIIATIMLLRIAAKHGYKPRVVGNVQLAANKPIIATFNAPNSEYFSEIFVRDATGKYPITHNRLLDIMPESSMVGRMIVYNADLLLYPTYTANKIHFLCAQGALKQMMSKYIFDGNPFYLRCYFDLIDAMAHMENSAPDSPEMNLFLCGTSVWPNSKAVNISMSGLYTLHIHEANLEDRREGRDDLPKVRAAIASRPPQLRMGDRNIDQKAKEFVEWSVQKRYFMVDGGRIER